jgi:glycosyltransferase involved in cell wall biosynthesis
MQPVSVIIITKNEAANVAACIQSARLLTSDVILIDTGSTDDTVAIARCEGARILEISWLGFGDARNRGASIALYDWILAIDADERVTPELVSSIQCCTLDTTVIYGFRRQNYFIGHYVRFGEWGRDRVYRLYNRTRVQWDLEPVHEILVGSGTMRVLIPGFVRHFPVQNAIQNTEKTNRYAALNAEKYFKNGKKASFTKRFLSPLFNFLKMYILFLGFLDGRAGFEIAWATTRYVWLKYHLLHQMYRTSGTTHA